MGFLTSFLYSQFLVTLPIPSEDCSGQTIIITGSNTGLGFEATRHLSRLNASLIIMAVRNISKGEVAKTAILQRTKRPANSIQVWELDLQSYDSIKAFVTKANQLPRIDGVLENAGMMMKHFKLVAGYESTITTNVIGTFLMALLILPKLKESASKYNIQPRISVVTSDLHFIARFSERNSKNVFEALNNEKTWEQSMERYSVSKLLEVLVIRELGSLLSQNGSKTTPVIVNCMTPGACKSDFHREKEGWEAWIQDIMAAIIGRTTEAGSRTLFAGIVAGEESNGAYMADCHIADPSPWVLSTEGQMVQKKVWSELLEILEGIQPGISERI